MAPAMKRNLGIAAIVAVILVVVAIIAIVVSNNPPGNSQAQSGTPAATIAPEKVSGGNQPSGTPAQRAAVSKWLAKYDWKRSEYSFRIVAPVSVERGANSVSAKPVITKKELVSFINGDSKRSKAYRVYVRKHMSAAQYRKVLQGDGFVRVQLLTPATYVAGSYLRGGEVYFTNAPRGVKKGDVLWVYAPSVKVTRTQPDGSKVTVTVTKVRQVGNTRAGCGNGHSVPRPSRSVPKAPPVSIPPTSVLRHKDSRSLSDLVKAYGRKFVFGPTKRQNGEHYTYGDDRSDKYPPHKVAKDPADAKDKSPIVNKPNPPKPGDPPVVTPPSTGGNTGQGAPQQDQGGSTVPPASGPTSDHTSDGQAPQTGGTGTPGSSAPTPPAPEDGAPPPPS